MSSYELCVQTPLPTFSSLAAALSGLMAQRPPSLDIPSLPTMPSPLYPNFYNPSIYLNMTASQLQVSQMLELVLAMFIPIAQILKVGLDDILPRIPILNINLIDLLEGSASTFIAKLEGIGISIAGFPATIYSHIISPAMAAVDQFQILVTNYFAALCNTLLGLVNRVAKILSAGGLSMPTVPDMSTVFTDFILPLLHINIPDIPSIPNIQSILALVKIPGFNFDSAFPIPYYIGLSMPEFEAVQIFKNFYANMITAPLQILLNFLQGLQINIVLPKICIPINT